ncbi:MAG: WD40 repeat domain-containing protein, partial [Ktedonobacteraceae bacterium]
NVRIWNASNGKTISTYPGDPGFKRSDARVLAWSSDGRLLVVGGSKYLHIWDTDAGRLLTKLRGGFSALCKALAWAPNAHVFAAALGNKVIVCILDARPSTVYYRYSEPVSAVAGSPDGKYMACGGYDRVVHVWNVRTDRLVGMYRSHIQPITAISWAPDSRRIVSGSFSDHLNVWDALTGVDIASYHAHAGSVLTVAWSPDGRSIISGGSDRRVCIWMAP